MEFWEWIICHLNFIILGSACGWALASARIANRRINDMGISKWKWDSIQRDIEEIQLKKYSYVTREVLTEHTKYLEQRICILETKLEERTGKN